MVSCKVETMSKAFVSTMLENEFKKEKGMENKVWAYLVEVVVDLDCWAVREVVWNFSASTVMV